MTSVSLLTPWLEGAPALLPPHIESAAETASHAEPAPAPEPATAPLPGPRRVLIVDDNQDQTESLSLLLRIWGFDTRVACDGDSALRVAPGFRPDVVLLDIRLPRMSGYEVALRLRDQLPGHGTVIVALSGSVERDRGRNSGIDQFLLKPIDPRELERLLSGIPAAGTRDVR